MSKITYFFHIIALIVIGGAGLFGIDGKNQTVFEMATAGLLLGAGAQLVALIGFSKSERVPKFANKLTFAAWFALLFPAAIVQLPNWNPVFAAISIPGGFLIAYLLISVLRLLWAVVERLTTER
ncbi:MAG: hypothetical protein KDD85_09785 [Parvularculaceae bacterium]|nr:hypothetical protein [Parvularculaceae bacterium]